MTRQTMNRMRCTKNEHVEKRNMDCMAESKDIRNNHTEIAADKSMKEKTTDASMEVQEDGQIS